MKRKIKAILSLALMPSIMLSGTISTYAHITEPEFDVIAKVVNNNGRNILVKNNELISTKPNIKNKKSACYPDYYNLYEQGKATDPKYQGTLGICWTFGALSSMESSILMKNNADKNIDLSERHLSWFTFNGKDYSEDKSLFAGEDSFSTFGYSPYNIGGSYYNSAATLMRRYGASDESICTYEFTDDGKLDDNLRTNADIYLDSMEILPSPAYYDTDSSGDISEQGLVDKNEFDYAINSIKEKLMTVGVVDFSIYEDNDYYNNETYSYYFDGSVKTNLSDNGFRFPNHEISIVGWDDNYSKDNFNTTPPADGAWIAKNNWSEKWGNNGFFYVSYYDISQSDFSSFKAEDTEYKSDGTTSHVYKNIYQYDGTIFGATQISISAKVEAANIFTARNNETLEAISSASLMPNTTFNYQIYTDLQDENNPESGTLAESGSKTYVNAGYYTIPLENAIPLDKGEKYSVVINISYDNNGAKNYVLPCEMNYSDIVELDVATDVSFYSLMDSDWDKIEADEDFYNFEIGNAIVKAYTNNCYESGDANKDGQLDIDDASTIQCHLAKLVTFDENTIALCELDGDGIITVSDVTYLQMKLAKIL